MKKLTMLLAALGPMVVLAQAPQLLGYQGRLLRADGTPEAGNVQMRFGLFAADTAGASLWEETQAVSLAQGFYSTYLGRVTTFPAGVFEGGTLWLEVAVQAPGDSEFRTMVPRQRVGSVAFALNARAVKGGAVDATQVSVNGAQVIDSSGRLTGAAAYSGGAGISIDPGSRAISIGAGTCTANQVLQWSGSSWACGSVSAGLSAVSGVAPITVANPASSPVVSIAVGTDAGTVAAGNDPRFLNATTLQGRALSPAAPLSGDVLRSFDGGWEPARVDVANTPGALVSRDPAGNFSAGTITATINGTATNVSGVVGLANGGTGAATAAAARTNLGLGTAATVNLSGSASTVLRGDGTFGAAPAPTFPDCNNVPDSATNRPCLMPLYRCPSINSANGVSAGPWASYGCWGQLSVSSYCQVTVFPQTQNHTCTQIGKTLLF